jgi:dTDP-4-amino-4,6-dideoxygalactose transaminase
VEVEHAPRSAGKSACKWKKLFNLAFDNIIAHSNKPLKQFINYLLLENFKWRTRFIAAMKSQGIQCVFHYLPLHDSPAGKKWGHACGDIPVTRHVSDCLVRLPLWIGLETELERIVKAVAQFFT